MYRRPFRYLILILCFSVAMMVSYTPSASAQGCDLPAARVSSVQGTVDVKVAGEATWQAVKLNDTYCPGDTIRVGRQSRADVSLANRSVLRLRADTIMTLDAVKEKKTSLVGLLKGAAHFFSRGPRSLEVRTPFTVAGVRGTEFLVTVEASQTLLSIFEGTVVAANEAGNLTLQSGQSAVAEAGKAPQLRVVARPRDAVQWALYYPPVVYTSPKQFQGASGWQERVRQSNDFYLQGNLQSAFDSIADAPEGISDPRFFAYRASLLLAVGRVDEARADIAQALSFDPHDSQATALQTIMAVVQNDKDTALQMAQNAVAATPDAATSHIALSYAQQAHFDLVGARASLEKAVALEPENALAWARLAELWSSFDNLDKALDAAKKAVLLEPNLSRTQTVLGFAFLTRVMTQAAKTAFARAIVLDQADPLPRLGLGLAKIREGKLHDGAQDMETAASLSPNDSLLHSYLGKTRFEEKQRPLDEREYGVAKKLDPNDPTPWFYDAIQKQTTNRPVEALHDLQKAIELNDNRAVYRSRLALDSDLAARSSGLARIYSDLGFQQRALVEGWNAVNTDPSNFSAHRFLADSYSALPRHEIARVSELLQSQLLQPLSLTPIQPRLAESNLFLISAGGPGALSFNEFNQLFNGDRLSVQASGLAGENDTFSGEGVVAGIYKKLSFSVGATHFETDGWRDNNDQEDDIVNAFVQVELSPKTSLQAEYRYRNVERGDLIQRFFPEDFFAGQRDTLERNTFRLGGRHAFSPSSILLGSFIYQDSDGTTNVADFPAPGSFTNIRIPQDAFSIELQHLFRSRFVSVRSGVGYFDINGDINLSFKIDLPPPPDGPGPIEDQATIGASSEHINVYAYADVHLLMNLTATVGLSVDSLNGEGEDGDKDQFNPKFGLIWKALPGTTIRAAAFRVLKRTLITDQTLEPTQVAGFNQFFDDGNLTESWRYGGAIDQKVTSDIFAGVEFSKRDLTVPFQDIMSDPLNPVSRDANWDEYLARAYLFWTPHPWLALRTEYIFERFERDEQFTFGIKELKTHRVPLGIKVFHPSGLNVSLTTTYWNQDGELEGFLTPGFGSASDDFWLFDLGIGYRLPKRYGFVSVGVTNLFDTHFKYFETDFDNSRIQPDRAAFVKATVAFP